MDTRLAEYTAHDWGIRNHLVRVRCLIPCRAGASGKWMGAGIAVIHTELRASLERGVV